MLAFHTQPYDQVVRSPKAASPDHQADDWEMILRENHHRMKNVLTLLGASVRRDFGRARSVDMTVAVDRFERRLVAFGRLYQLLSDNAGQKPVSIGVFFRSLCVALSEAILEPAGIRCELSVESGELPAFQCHRLALILAEFITNAAKHAFPGRTDGVVRLEVAHRQGCWCCTVEDNGVGAVAPLQGTGGRILEGLARSIRAEIYGETGRSGTKMTILVPQHHDMRA